jgi:hypothetical protein
VDDGYGCELDEPLLLLLPLRVGPRLGDKWGAGGNAVTAEDEAVAAWFFFFSLLAFLQSGEVMQGRTNPSASDELTFVWNGHTEVS